MKNKIRILLLSFSFFLITSCKGIIEDGSIGPCVHEYQEAIFHITDITDSISRTPISFVKLIALKINERDPIGSFFKDKNYGIVYSDTVYYCNIPCGFGIEPGSYEFMIIADGYKEKIVKYENVDYSVYKGGCPSYNDGGKRVTIIMSKK